MSDVLSSASLLLSLLGILYGLWYPELRSALDEQVPKHAADRVAPRLRVSGALRARAVPLLVASTVLVVIFLPDAVCTLKDAIQSLSAHRAAALRSYSAAKAGFVCLVIMAGAVAAHSLSIVIKLRKKLVELKPENA